MSRRSGLLLVASSLALTAAPAWAEGGGPTEPASGKLERKAIDDVAALVGSTAKAELGEPPEAALEPAAKDEPAGGESPAEKAASVAEKAVSVAEKAAPVAEAAPPADEAEPPASEPDPPAVPAPPARKLEVAGWVENVYLEPWGHKLKAKLDTGATTSSLSARNAEYFLKDDQEWVRFELHLDLADEHPKVQHIEGKVVREARIRQHGRVTDVRPVVVVPICFSGKKYKVQFTLTPREGFSYPMLLGRRFLSRVAMVDPGKTFLIETPCEYPKPEPVEEAAAAAEGEPVAGSEPQADVDPAAEAEAESEGDAEVEDDVELLDDAEAEDEFEEELEAEQEAPRDAAPEAELEESP